MEGTTGISTLTTALTSGLTTAGNDILSAMGSIIPAALVVLGGYMVIRMAIKTFKQGTR